MDDRIKVVVVGGNIGALNSAGYQELPAPLPDTRAWLELVRAMDHSGRSGQAVTLPLRQDHPVYASWLPAELVHSV